MISTTRASVICDGVVAVLVIEWMDWWECELIWIVFVACDFHRYNKTNKCTFCTISFRFM